MRTPTASPANTPVVLEATTQSAPTEPATPTATASATAIAEANVTPTSLSGTRWKTYTNTTLQVAVDYSPDWSVREEATGATFTSPQGLQIQLAQVNTGKLSPEDYVTSNEQDLPNTRCTSSTNAYGAKARVCFDTIAFSSAASVIVKSPDGTTRLLSLALGGKARNPQVLNAMVASMRPSA